ncbi:adenylyl-sulfate kinase [Cellulomonas palmilytica]|uniref:adenylyl-sulfate kinase n=1 Tax=Cellulomonas palmilytica TaxID=2608402 RepID=UPI001F461D89|nr:adenylyl-sulfate kinase [Cellulomonas palmilytica]UJP39552.1 adenylyl-sulfate kinase [Cellulomonas palmilytica]
MSDEWTRWSGLPQLVLGATDADAVELALGGAIPPERHPVVAAAPDGAVVLLDDENTPVAVRERGGEALAPLRPRGLRGGEDADPRARLAARDVRDRLAPGPVLGVLVDDVLGLHQVDALVERAAGAGAVLLLCLVAPPRPAHALDVTAAGVVRAATAVRDELTRSGRTAVPVDVVAVPWAHDARLERLAWPAGEPALDELARAYGATDVLDLTQAPSAARAAYVEAEQRRAAVLEAQFPPAAARELASTRDSGSGPGAVVLFTGLSGSGKSTVAKAVAQRLQASVSRQVTVLDGDEVRHMLSAGLGFDRESRSQNVRRIGYVASLVAGAGGIVLVAAIAPFEEDRADVRRRTEAVAGFVLVHVATPLEVCEARDRKHLYARARAGDLPEFTGVSSPYEVPQDADVVLDTSHDDIGRAVDTVLEAVRAAGVDGL